MATHTISTFRDARILDMAKEGSTMSEISRQTGIPFATVRRVTYAFEGMGVIRSTKIGKKVFVRINKGHPVVDPMFKIARLVNGIIWDPNTFVADICRQNNIEYAFVGTSKIRYIRNESRNMVQIAIPSSCCQKAKKTIQNKFKEIGIKTTDDASETIGRSMSLIYIRCFPVDKISYTVYKTKTSFGEISANVADTDTEKNAIQKSSKNDRAFIPFATY